MNQHQVRTHNLDGAKSFAIRFFPLFFHILASSYFWYNELKQTLYSNAGKQPGCEGVGRSEKATKAGFPASYVVHLCLEDEVFCQQDEVACQQDDRPVLLHRR